MAKTWAEYREHYMKNWECGYSGDHLHVYRHGMRTIFDLVESMLPDLPDREVEIDTDALMKTLSRNDL